QVVACREKGFRGLHGGGHSGVLATSPTTTGSVACMIKPYETCLNTRKMNKLPTCSSGSLTCGLPRLCQPLLAVLSATVCPTWYNSSVAPTSSPSSFPRLIDTT